MVDSRAELEAAKEQKFRALLRHVSTRSPYYANIIRERRLDVNTCSSGDFPVLTKAMLMANFDAIVTDRRVTKQVIAEFLSRSTDPKERLFNELTVMHTSGTSGEVGYFLYSPADFGRVRAAAMRNRRAFRGQFPPDAVSLAPHPGRVLWRHRRPLRRSDGRCLHAAGPAQALRRRPRLRGQHAAPAGRTRNQCISA